MSTFIYGILLCDRYHEVNKVFPNLHCYSSGGLIPSLDTDLVLLRCPDKTDLYVFGRTLDDSVLVYPPSVTSLSSWKSSEKGIDAAAEISKIVEKSGLQRKLDIYVL